MISIGTGFKKMPSFPVGYLSSYFLASANRVCFIKPLYEPGMLCLICLVFLAWAWVILTSEGQEREYIYLIKSDKVNIRRLQCNLLQFYYFHCIVHVPKFFSPHLPFPITFSLCWWKHLLGHSAKSVEPNLWCSSYTYLYSGTI